MNCLVEIPFEDWPNLRKLYVNHILESNSCYLIDNYINWLNKDPTLEEKVKIYSLNGDWSDGTFIIQDHKYLIMMNTLEDTQERLLAALNCLDKKSAYIFLGCPMKIKKTVETYLRNSGNDVESLHFNTVIWHHIELKKALEFNTDPPKGITLSTLRLEDINTINNEWPHKYPGSELFVGRLVRFNQNIGAYDENGKLVAWCLTLPFGALGLLQVLSSHKRKGLGSLVVRAMAKMSATKGIETIGPVQEENSASRGMFESLGFREIDKVFWFSKPAH